ncbi:MAG: helicase C-terminal domain-containing protein [Longimicrobiales bacterium]|nr:helicase C-terminal domain-containing protein [Longimicrobiales bacterium]
MSADPSLDPGRALAGLDGLEGRDRERPAPPARAADARPLTLSAEAAERMRAEILRARGREVCFLADVTPAREVVNPRAVSRGNQSAVLAVARDAPVGSLLVHNHPSGLLEPSDADLAVAARVHEDGLGTAITDNDARTLYVVVEPPAPRTEVPLALDDLAALLAPDGSLAAAHPVYEDRPGQREMLRMVGERYNDGGIALIEAGTGTGKSLAYLLPAVRWALENGERTVVSTNTINLQEQLVAKDLPLVSRLVGEEVPWALVKGRGNYVSIRRALLAARSAPDLFDEDRDGEIAALLDWLRETGDGSLSDLTFTPSDDLWEEVRSDPDACLRARCPHFQECHFQRARRRASAARILVVNHHLLFTDVAVRRATGNWTQSAVLPPWRRLVLDEAHNVEDAATSHLGVEVSRRGLYRLLGRLDRRGRGVLGALDQLLRGDGGRAQEHRARLEERVRPRVEDARARLGVFLDTLEPRIPRREGVEAFRIGTGEGTIPEPAADEGVRERLHALIGALGDLARELGELRRRVEGDEGLAPEVEARLLDVRGSERRLAAAEVALRLVFEPGEQAAELVRWVEVRGRGPRSNLVLAAAPVELGRVLRENLFARVSTAVLTSATLTTRRTFDFLKGRLGLGPEDLSTLEDPLEVVERMLPSPFDFARQTLFLVPSDLPDVRGAPDALDRATARVVVQVAEATDGGIVALFTSFRALRAVAGHLRAGRAAGAGDGIPGLRWPLFVQGEGHRSGILRDFVEAGRGILLGTASFWEGVDVPGDPLRGLVIQKLPFRVPTEPVTAARIEALEARGADAFRGYLLPLAALRLKQGFGRLIRGRTDRGVVVLLDDRILRRTYGRYLLQSLPEAPLVRGPWEEMRGRLSAFYRAAP